MRFLKWKSILNVLSCGGIRAIVVSSALLGSVLITYAGYSLYEQIYTQNRAFDSGVERFTTTEEIQEAQQSLTDSMQDYRAWLRVEDTHIDYPVVQGKDDLYYASHDINGKSSLTGAIYMAAANAADLSDNYIVVYGHHMDNGAMFGDLDRFAQQSFLEAHQKGVLICGDNTYDITFFAIVKTDAYNETVYDAGSRKLPELLAYVNRQASAKTDADTADATKIVALSTCASAQTNGRLILFGIMTLVEKQVTPTPTEEVTPTTEPTVTTEPTNEPTVTGQPTITEEPTVTAGPTASPRPTEIAGLTPTPTGEPTITPEASVTPVPSISVVPTETPTEAPKSGISRFFDRFLPGGSSYGEDAWALVNLIALIVTVYILLPINRLRWKYGRIKRMREMNEAQMKAEKGLAFTADQIAKFTRKFITGVATEAVLSLAAFIIFILTENMRKPMVLIDKWTPLMLIVLFASWVVDFTLTRSREGKESDNQ